VPFVVSIENEIDDHDDLESPSEGCLVSAERESPGFSRGEDVKLGEKDGGLS
jgi:hypothetical protein